MTEKTNGLHNIIIVFLIIIILVLAGTLLLDLNPITYQKEVEFDISSDTGWVLIDFDIETDHDLYFSAFTENEWNEHYEKAVYYNESKHIAPDFENYGYIYVYWEPKGSSNYRINITSISIDMKNNLYVNVEKTEVGGIGLSVMTYPDIFVQIPKSQLDNSEISQVYFSDIEVYVPVI